MRRCSNPKGGAERESKKNWPVTKSPVKPYPARTDVRPSPFGSQEIPTRGARFDHTVFMPELPGKPGSPG